MAKIIGFTDPVFFIRIADADGKTHVFATAGKVGIYGRYVSKVSIVEELSGIGKMSVTLTPPYKEAQELLSSSILSLGNILEVQWGYASIGMRTAYGMLTVPDLSLEESNEITLNANGLAFGLLRRSKRRVWRDDPADQTSPALSPEFIVHELAVELGIEDLEIDFVDDRFAKRPSIPFVQVGETSWDFIRKLAQRHGADAYMVGGTKLVVADHQLIFSGKSPVAAILRRYGQLDTGKNIFPLLSFSTDTAGQVLGLRARGLVMQGVNPDKGPGKPLNEGTSTDMIKGEDVKKVASDTKKVTAGAGTSVKAVGFPDIGGVYLDKDFDPKRDAGKFVSVSEREESIQQRLQSEFDNAKIEVLKASLRTMGLPFLQPSNFVKVEGVGTLFDSIYQIFTVSHELGAGYDMSLDVRGQSVPARIGSDANVVQRKNENNPDRVTVGKGV